MRTTTELSLRTETTYSPYRWVILIAAYLAFLSQYVTYLAWNPFIPLSKELFGFTMTQAGSLITATVLGRTIFQIPGGIMVDKFNMKYLLSFSLLILGISTFCMGLISTYAGMMVFRFLIGVASIIVFPVCVKLITTWFPPNQKATALGLLLTGTTFAVTITNAVIPYVTKNFGWIYPFYGIGSVLAIMSVFVFFTIKPNLSISSSTQSQQGSKLNRESFKVLLKNKNLLITIITFTGALWATWGTAAWTLAYLTKKVGITLVTAGAMMSVFGICGALSKPIVGFISDKIGGKKKQITVINMGLLAIMLMIMPFIESQSLLWVYVGLMGILAFAYSSPLNLMIAEAVDKNFTGTAVSLSLFISQIGLMIQPLIIGRVLDVVSPDVSYIMAFMILAAGAASGFFGGLFIKEK